MATSGLIQGTVTQRTDRFRSFIYWADVSPSQDWRITNNMSVVRIYSIVDTSIEASDWVGACMSYTQTIDGQTTTYGNFTSDSNTSWTWATAGASPTGRVAEGITQAIALYKDYNIPHNADGTKTVSFTHSYSLPSGGYGPGNVSVSGSFVLDTIPRASQPTLDAATKDFGGTFTITTNRVSTSFTHTISYAFGTASGTIASGVGASTTWLAPTSLGSQIPTVMSGVGTITCDTYNGATFIGSKTVAFTLTVPSSWVATLTTASSGYSWVNSPANLVGYVIQNISTLTLTLAASLNSLVSSYGTTITAYQVRFSSYNSGEVTYANSTASKAAGLVAVSGTQYAYYKIKDARGNWSNEVSEQIMGSGGTIYAYAAPANNGFNVARNATVLTTADFIMNFSRSSINNANTWSYRRQYYNGSSWVYIDGSAVNIAADTITSTLTHSLPYVEANVYQVRVLLTDLFTTNIAYDDTLPTSDVPFVLTQYGAGIGKIPTGGGTYDLEVGTGGIRSDGNIYIGANAVPTAASIIDLIYPVGRVITDTNSANPGTYLTGTTWIAFGAGRVLIGVGTSDQAFTAGTTGGSSNHTLDTTQIPSHNHIQDSHNHTQNSHAHAISRTQASDTGTTRYNPTNVSASSTYQTGDTVATNIATTATNQATGGGLAHNNLQPYVVVYMWKRTA